MIDEFIEFICVPSIVICLHVLFFYLNMISVKETDRLGLFKSIIWTILTLIIFPSLLGMVLQITINFVLVFISLGLMFMQILMNVEFILTEYNIRKKESRF